MPYAGFWRRAAAYLLDIVLLAAIFALFFGIDLGAGRHGALTAAAFGVVVAWLYFAGMESSKEQATLGKMALRIRVTDLDGARIGFARATGRLFAKILSALILYIGFLMVAFTARKQGLHDMLAGTLVLEGRAEALGWPAPPTNERRDRGA